MGRNARRRKQRRAARVAAAASWVAEDGVHAVVPGKAPSAAQLAQLTRQYQERIRRSPLYDEMLREFGAARAEELLMEFQVKLA